MGPPRILIVAGPNGAGKTTFAREFLPREGQYLTFLNADLIAAGLSPFRPEAAAVRAARIMLTEIAACVARRASFAFETTLAGQGYLKAIPRWRAAGCSVRLVFLRLPNVEAARQRVFERVRQGGHDVPEANIRRRFERGLANLPAYQAAVEAWRILDNLGPAPILVAEGGSW